MTIWCFLFTAVYVAVMMGQSTTSTLSVCERERCRGRVGKGAEKARMIEVKDESNEERKK